MPMTAARASTLAGLVADLEIDLTGPAPEPAEARLDPDRQELFDAVDWYAAHGETETGLRMATALWRYTLDRGCIADGRTRLVALLAQARGIDDEMLADAYYGAGTLAFRQGDNTASRDLQRQSVEHARLAGSRRAEAVALCGLARCGLRDGDLTQAETDASASAAIWRELADERGLETPLHLLAYAAYIAGDDETARARFLETLDLSRRLGMDSNVAGELTNLGSVETRAGHLDRAEAYCLEALRIADRIGGNYLVPYCVVNVGGVLAARGDYAAAARLLGAGKAMFDADGAAIDPGTAIEYERYVRLSSEALGEEAFAAETARGRAWSPDEAVRHALGARRSY